jgi:hypothetical protein
VSFTAIYKTSIENKNYEESLGNYAHDVTALTVIPMPFEDLASYQLWTVTKPPSHTDPSRKPGFKTPFEDRYS